MSKREKGQEKEVTFYKGTPEEKKVTLHETGGYVGAHKGTHGAYGVAAVTERLKGLDFPASKADVVGHIGNEDVQWSKERSINLRVIFDRMPERFDSPVEVVKVISEHLDEIGPEEQGKQ